MDIDFGYLFHNIQSYDTEDDRSLIDKFYSKLDIELKSYVDHLVKSLEGYITQERQLIENLKLSYPNYDQLSAEFDGLFNQYKEEYEEQVAFQLANKDSGMDQIDQEIHHASEDINNTFIYIQDTFLKSSLIYLYSILESHLRELCIILKQETKSNLDISDLSSRNYLETCYIYLSKVIDLDIKNIQVYESNLKEFQNLRNILVHEFGLVTDQKENQIKKILNSYKGIDIHENKIQINNNSILIAFLQSIIMTFQELYWIIDKKTNYKTLTSRVNQELQFISKKLTSKITDVKFSAGLTDAKFRNKVVSFEIIHLNRQVIAVGEMAIKTHKTKASFKVQLNETVKISKSLRNNYKRIIKNSTQNPNLHINNIFQNFYLTQKLFRKVEINIKPILAGFVSPEHIVKN